MVEKLKTIKVTILGKNYILSTDDNEQTVLNAVELVDRRMKEISNAMKLSDGQTAAVLVALELADEIKKQQLSLTRWQKKASDLGSLISSKIS